MTNENITAEDVKAVLKFIIAGYYCDVINEFQKTQAPNKSCLAKFNMSEKDKELLNLVANGLTNEQIAKRLNIAADTVKTNIDEVFAKLENQDKTKFARFVLNNNSFVL